MKDDTIRISIVVPIYNVENYVRQCIESIMGQSYRNLEIILVDDGSTDHCPNICDDYAKKDKRIHVIHQCNGGLVTARKAGAAAASGDYVLAVDGDDWIAKDRVEDLVRKGILPTHADMIYLSGRSMDFEEDGRKSIYESTDVPTKLFENDEIKSKFFPLLPDRRTWSLGAWAIRRELLLKNQKLVDNRVIYGEDFLCVFFCLLEAKSVMTIRQGGYHYVQRASSISHQRKDSLNPDQNSLRIWYRVLKNRLEQAHMPPKICNMCDHIAISYIMDYYYYDYDLLLQNFPADYLFPFLNVKNGSRIVVYGAGRIGYSLVQSLSKTKKYSVVLWVDQNQNRPAVPGYTISPRNAILSTDYDFIVVAIVNAAVAEEVKHSLILDGVPEKKIATMDARAIL